MWSTAREIADGDLVIIWQTRENIQPLLVKSGNEMQSKFGYYRHSDFIGLPYGSKVGSRNGKGFIHVLRPTPELWTMALPHRTQILYLADISFVTSYLGIHRGSTVIEAGTGSGSFTHSLARTVGTAGHIWSYEFHEQRATKAREEFAQHGMSDIVTLTHRNVCRDGFTVENSADSVFLDLPAPWEAVEHAKKALRKDRTTRICCFSPCMEQVLRTVSALNDASFSDITMYETLSRPVDVHQIPEPLPLSSAITKLHRSEVRREGKRQRQIAQSRDKFKTGVPQPGKRKRENGADVPGSPPSEGETLESKRPKREDEQSAMDVDPEVISVQPAIDEYPDTTPAPRGETVEETVAADPINVSRIFSEVRGHTSYLTFATLVPDVSGNDDTHDA